MQRVSFLRTAVWVALPGLLLLAINSWAYDSPIIWHEAGDAGALPISAQVTSGHSCLQTILGAFDPVDSVDMYAISIAAPTQLSISLLCAVNGDPDLWLFDQSGQGMSANATCNTGSKLILNTFVSNAGIYYVAVGLHGLEPHSGSGAIWATGVSGEHAPDGTGSAGAVNAWINNGAQPTSTPYEIRMVGVDFADQLPPPDPDYNGDGLYDYCDEIHLGNYYLTGDWRADLHQDCWLNIVDVATLGSLMCSTGASTVADRSEATIEVYFDEAGTVRQLDNVTVGATIDLYVIARNLATGISAFSFTLETNQNPVTFINWPAPVWGMTGEDPNHGHFSRCFLFGDCLEPVNGEATLLHCQFLYLGAPAHNCTFRITSPLVCDKPSKFPGFMACANECNWNYFAPTVSCPAVINPDDIGDDGIDDVCTCRYFKMTGDSDGIGWNMAVRVPAVFPDSWFFHMSNTGLPVGAPASAFVSVIVDWVNTLPRFHAGLYDADDTYFICGPNEYEIGAAPYQSSPACWVPPSAGCEFNPYMQEIFPQTSAVPEQFGFSLVNYPNPFNPGTQIVFDLPAAARVRLDVYDLGGRMLRPLVADQAMAAGRHAVDWDGRDQHGKAMAAGVYIYRLRANQRSESRRMVLLK